LVGIDNHLIGYAPDCKSSRELIQTLFCNVHRFESNEHLDE
jgi:hypothetical protein